ECRPSDLPFFANAPSSTSNDGFATPLNGGGAGTQLNRIAFIGNSLPRRCGIAPFTTDLQQAIATSGTNVETSIVAMTDNGHAYDYLSSVRLQIHDDRLEDYIHAPGVLNEGQFAFVSFKHK